MSTVKTAIRARVSMTLNRCAETNASYGRTRHWRLEILSCPAFPALCSAIVVQKASTRSGTITIVLCQYLLIGSAREAYIKKQGELYFGIALSICCHQTEKLLQRKQRTRCGEALNQSAGPSKRDFAKRPS